VFGISSKGSIDSSIVNSEQYRVGYGVRFSANDNQKPDTFMTFIDVPVGPAAAPGENTQFNFSYDNSDPVTSTITLTQGEKIRRFCGHRKGGAAGDWVCWDTTATAPMSLDIVFVKPDPDAHITLGINNSFDSDFDQAKVVIESGLGDKCRTVRVWVSGQVSIDPIDSKDQSHGCEVDG
jgi:hypothetical protein